MCFLFSFTYEVVVSQQSHIKYLVSSNCLYYKLKMFNKYIPTALPKTLVKFSVRFSQNIGYYRAKFLVGV